MSDERFKQGQRVKVEGIVEGHEKGVVGIKVSWGVDPRKPTEKHFLVPQEAVKPIGDDMQTDSFIPGQRVTVEGIVTGMQTHHHTFPEGDSSIGITIRFGPAVGHYTTLNQRIVSAADSSPTVTR